MKKKIFCGIIIILGLAGFFILKNRKSIPAPNTDYVAMIYHSEMLGIDAGTECTYYIYPSSNHTYLYVKTTANITIAGASEAQKIDSEKLNDKSDLEKISKDIEKDKMKGAERYVCYSFIENNSTEEFETIEELAEKLFGK